MTQQLIDSSGQPVFGVLDPCPQTINAYDFDYRSPMGRKLGILSKKIKLNRFQFFGLVSDEYAVGVAIVHLGWVSSAFCYLLHKERGMLLEANLQAPFALGTKAGLQPDQDSWSFKQGNKRISIRPLENGDRQINVAIGNRLKLQCQLHQPANFEPLSVCTKTGINGWTFTRKSAGLPVTGILDFENQQTDLQQAGFLGSLDWSCGYMRRETCWNWVCISGKLANGKNFGVNLAAGVNETGFTENVMWVDNQRIKLDMALFNYQQGDDKKPWKIITSDGNLELEFIPASHYGRKLKTGLIDTRFKQYYGHFKGRARINTTDQYGKTIGAEAEEWIDFEALPGFTEEHYARW
ncbi:DUF2804 domain-containing protein [Pelagibaculum spongiae]|uniref:DUF2804 domain-containing protein n=1 Tax=Pelagibaculum spongiae TaxID=2080658 RepID=A0A2V1GXD7_9GAMM|nr:DUF2804 domain-containing protein [Pelagibaculum spongiae]PVZ69658.1 DUF2804 domain-containing protein [Pelagibaculum spongiae]